MELQPETREMSESTWVDEYLSGPPDAFPNTCGCGQPEKIYAYLHNMMRMMKRRSDSNWKDKESEAYFNDAYDDMAKYLALYLLDAQGYAEHGGQIISSWLTRDGEEALKLLDSQEPSNYGH